MEKTWKIFQFSATKIFSRVLRYLGHVEIDRRIAHAGLFPGRRITQFKRQLVEELLFNKI
jgi:hypothetical protein